MKWKKGPAGPIHLLAEVLDEKQIDMWNPNTDDPDDWALYWIGFVPQSMWAQLLPHQMVPFMPGTKALCHKVELHKNIVEMKKKFSEEEFDFWPRGYAMPDEYEALKAYWESFGDELHPFIMKPPNAARGERIEVFTSISQVDLDSHFITVDTPLAQEYIMNPLLIEGHKLSLRVYVALTGVDPLRLYVFPNGLVRICSEKYTTDRDSFSSVFVHLTNIDLNKHNPHATQFKLDTIPHDGLRL
jgi:hypothetical protein